MANLDLLNQFWKRTEQEAEFRGYASAVRRLRPFTLDAELADICGQLADTNERTLRSYLHTARLPYPMMWLECDHATAFKHIDRSRSGWRLHEAEPIRVGWLIVEAPEGSGVYAITRVCSMPDPNDGEVKALIFPITHLYSPTVRLDTNNALRSLEGRIHEDVLRALRELNQDPTFPLAAWGGDSLTVHKIERRGGVGPHIEMARKSPLYQSNVCLLEPRMLKLCVEPITPDDKTIYERTRSVMFAGLADQMGEVGFVVSALALLNEVPVKYVPYKPKGSIRVKTGMRPYMTSSIVSIEVPATRRRIKEIEKHLKGAGEAARRARHEVRGHWRHTDKLPGTNPDRWERFIDRDGRLRWRTWIDHHERGDASLGWVKQTYHASKGRGRIPGVEGDENGALYA